MAVGDGITWDETTPTDASLATKIDDYNRDVRKGIRSRMAREHEFPASQTGTSEGGAHKFVTFQAQGAKPTLSGTQVGAAYMSTADTYVIESSDGTITTLVNAGGGQPRSAGSIVQVVNVMDGAVDTGTTAMVMDDTIPQITEGNEFMTLAITPTSATNKLKIEVVCNVGYQNDASRQKAMGMALFQNTTANALAAVYSEGTSFDVTASQPRVDNLILTHYMDAGTTSAITFKVRAGCASPVTMTFNGDNAGRVFGGKMASSITITEIQV